MAPFSPSGRVCQLYCDADQSGVHEGLKPLPLPGMMFGPEGAGLGEIADADVYAGMSHPPHVPIGLDQDIAYHPWSESAAQDLYSTFAHGEPTVGLTQHVADMSTHYVGDNPERVVLGQFAGQEGG